MTDRNNLESGIASGDGPANPRLIAADAPGSKPLRMESSLPVPEWTIYVCPQCERSWHKSGAKPVRNCTGDGISRHPHATMEPVVVVPKWSATDAACEAVCGCERCMTKRMVGTDIGPCVTSPPCPRCHGSGLIDRAIFGIGESSKADCPRCRPARISHKEARNADA